MAGEREVTSNNQEASKPIVIRDGDGMLELWPQTINGVQVYTTTEEKTAELRERFDRRVVPVEKRACRRKTSE
jgi:hypothetical protein